MCVFVAYCAFCSACVQVLICVRVCVVVFSIARVLDRGKIELV